MTDREGTGREGRDRIAEAARRIGVEFDEEETAAWLEAIAAEADAEITVHADSGTFGHRVSMLDFSPRELERFRRIGALVELTGPPGVAESALALSGSAAQSKIQSYPGDCDYFERLNIRAATREAACAVLAAAMREKILAFERGPGYQFVEAKLGSLPVAGLRHGSPAAAGSPLSWTLDEVRAGAARLETPAGSVVIAWEEAAADPGWVKLDWVVADGEHGGIASASNVVDVTWEAPDGAITPLDGYLDAAFQEVYLDAEDLPLFARLIEHVSDDALDEYVAQLEAEVRKYLTRHVNYGKAAKRMYNVFRFSGRYDDAAFIRELFDEPTTILYRVWSLIGSLDDATAPGSSIPLQTVLDQADRLIVETVAALEGDEETEIVSALLGLRGALTTEASDEDAALARADRVEGAKDRVINVVNTFFRDRLTSVPSIEEYIARIQAEGAQG